MEESVDLHEEAGKENELGRSVWENLHLGRWYSPHCVRSVLATSVRILPYRPPAGLIRAK